MLNNKRSSDVYRKLRTNIEFNNKYPNIQSICLTSVNKGSGTTKIACNLASTFLLNHSNVLLVDCNFNKPKINKIFNFVFRIVPMNLTEHWGSTEYL